MCFARNFSVLSYHVFIVSCNLRMANGLDTSPVLKYVCTYLCQAKQVLTDS
jgi:hypothetical protein